MMSSSFNNPVLVKILFTVMVARLGGVVKITQSDIDELAYTCLQENVFKDGPIEFRLIERAKSS